MAARRVCVSERSVHNMCIGNTKYELVNTYARQQARFTKQSIIRCAFEFQQVVQIRVVGSQPGKDAFAFAAALGWDKTMCMVLS